MHTILLANKCISILGCFVGCNKDLEQLFFSTDNFDFVFQLLFYTSRHVGIHDHRPPYYINGPGIHFTFHVPFRLKKNIIRTASKVYSTADELDTLTHALLYNTT